MTAPDPAAQARGTAEAVARRSYGRLLAFLAARAHDVAAAEDSLSEAFAAALERWPRDGCPANPEGWLLTVARRRAIDSDRRAATGDAAAEIIRRLTDPAAPADVAGTIPDQRLAMMFACAHPAIDSAIHAPLMLQVVLGLDARAIAAAFLTSPAAMAKRLVRAKARIRDESIPLAVPEPEELPGRLGPVLDAIYAAFTEGWGDPGGVDPIRRDLAEEAIFLARLITELLPAEPEGAGLLALMLYAESRRRARRSDDGEFVPLDHQDQGRWDWPMIHSANALLTTAGRANSIGRYQVEAALQSAHILRHASGRPNWAEVVSLYDGLHQLTGSPVVLVNRALALAELEGADVALAELDTVAADPRLAGYQPYWVARGELLHRLGRADAAILALEIALGLEREPAVRTFLQRRITAVSA